MDSKETMRRSLVGLGVWVCLAAAASGTQAPQDQRIDIDELKEVVADGATMLLIDVREDYEVDSGSMPGSIHIPLGELEDRMSDIPKDVRLVFF